MPRFILFVRATEWSETGAPGEPAMYEAMTTFNESMASAGIVLQRGEGLHPSFHDGRRVIYDDNNKPTIEKGPFPANELVSGFWIIKVEDVEEAVEWAAKAPFGKGAVTEVRRIADKEDFGDELTPEVRAREEKLRAELVQRE
ncbi:hypothetical protein B0J14DRAFT_606946 [Halenospora varia]|nr:hypothetical protein B0J14DRAFT_606946 [Halenospora varia]